MARNKPGHNGRKTVSNTDSQHDEDTGFHVPGLLAHQMRNYAAYNAQRLREARRDIKNGRIDDVVYDTLDLAIDALAAFAKIGQVGK